MRKLKIKLRNQKNANRDYFYPACDVSEALLALMKRKALVPKDKDLLIALIDAMELELDIEIVAAQNF